MFNQAAVTSVNPPIVTPGSLLVSWTGALPAGQVWQVYLDAALAGHTDQNRLHVPLPTQQVQITIGTVLTAEADQSFSSSLAPLPQTRAELAWQGGRFEDPLGDVKGFRVYGELTPGGGVDRAVVLADIPLFTGRVATDGFGIAGYGAGGFGYGAGQYGWTSDSLTSGTWTFLVVPYDAAGNEGTAATVPIVIHCPPEEPPPFPDNKRLHYSLLAYSETPFGIGGYGEPEIVLTWLASTD